MTPLAAPSQESEVAALRRQVAVLRGIVDVVPAMLAFWNADERCEFANRAYEDWFGVNPEALIGTTLSELLGPIYPLNKKHIDAALRGEPQEFEREIPDPRGGTPRFSKANYLPRIEAGEVQGFYVLVTDITNRRRIEHDLIIAKNEAEEALGKVRTLQGLLPVCAWCRKIRDPNGAWDELERFLTDFTDATVTHGICESCGDKFAEDALTKPKSA